MFGRIFAKLKNINIKNKYVNENILLIGNKLYFNNHKIVKQSVQKDLSQKRILFKNNKEPNIYDYSINVLNK